MTDSSPINLSSFDPALLLHSQDPDLPSESFSDELEALNAVRLEKTRNKVVIQHRAWNLSDVFRSDEDVRLGALSLPTTEDRLFQRIVSHTVLLQIPPQDHRRTLDLAVCFLQSVNRRSRPHLQHPKCRLSLLLSFLRERLLQTCRNGSMASSRSRQSQSGRRSWAGFWMTTTMTTTTD